MAILFRTPGSYVLPNLLGADPLRIISDLMRWDPLLSPDRTAPAIRFNEDDDKVQVTLDLPGVDPSELDLTVREDMLIIEGHREDAMFSEAIKLPSSVELDHIEADLKNGVLTVLAPKRPETKPRRIALATGGQPSPVLDVGSSEPAQADVRGADTAEPESDRGKARK